MTTTNVPAPAPPPEPAPPPPAASRAREWRVGALVVAAGLVLLFVLVATGPLRIAGGRRLAIDFGFAGPIKPGAAVRVSGVVVGAVTDVEFLGGIDPKAGPDDMVRVHCRVDEKAAPVLTTTAQFYVTTLGVLGEHYVDVVPRPGGQPLPDGAEVEGVDLARADLLLPRAAALLEILSAILDENREEATELVRGLSSLIRRLDAMLGEDGGTDAAAEEARALLVDVRALVGGLRTAIGDGETLRGAIARGDRLAQAIEQAEPGALAGDVRRTLAVLNEGLAGDPEAQRRALARFEATFATLDQVAARADRLLAQIERGEGGAGKAFHDEELVRDLKAVLKGLSDNPVRFLMGRDK